MKVTGPIRTRIVQFFSDIKNKGAAFFKGLFARKVEEAPNAKSQLGSTVRTPVVEQQLLSREVTLEYKPVALTELTVEHVVKSLKEYHQAPLNVFSTNL